MSFCNALTSRQFAPALGRAMSEPFSCEVQRSKRKTLALYVKPGKLIVRAPLDASKSEVEDFVHSNRAWIEKRLSEESVRQQERLVVEHGRQIFYRARELEIVFRKGDKPRIMTDGGQFIIQGHRLAPAKAREQLEDFLIDKASHYILPRARGLARYLGVEHKISEIKLRKTKSKWGHCTSQGCCSKLAHHAGAFQHHRLHDRTRGLSPDPYGSFETLLAAGQLSCPEHEQYIRWLKEHEHRFWF